MTNTVNVDLTAVIGWLENGCAVEPAITELKIYQARLAAAQKADHVPDASNMIEAPKVEQEPVAWRRRLTWADVWTVFSDKAEASFYSENPETIVEPLYAHPAPASDELLEALEVIQDKLKFCTDEGPEGEGWLSKELEQAWVVVSDYINQHKGPQS